MAVLVRSGVHPNVSGGRNSATFDALTKVEGETLFVSVAGELDGGGRHLVTHSCLQRGLLLVRVEMSNLTFMDSEGYGGFVAARRLLERCGGSLTLDHATGQPERFLAGFGDLRHSGPSTDEG